MYFRPKGSFSYGPLAMAAFGSASQGSLLDKKTRGPISRLLLQRPVFKEPMNEDEIVFREGLEIGSGKVAQRVVIRMAL